VSRLLIIDGHAYAYRAFFAIRNLRSPSGHPVNAIYGFVKMLEKMRLALSPTHLIVVWDGGLSAERVAALPEYKAQRPEMPVDLESQFDGVRQYLGAAGLLDYCGEGVEADDYIACLARSGAQAGWDVVIASADKDFMQLVSERIGLLNPNDKSGTVWRREQVCAKAGVEPEQVADWLALMGDAVDNIPGVPGVGPKTAAGLLREFGSVEALYARMSEVKSEKIAAALRASTAVVKKNLELVKLHNVPCNFLPEEMKPRLPDREKLKDLFRLWGFKRMLDELMETLPGQPAELF
jgi:DNA polymerase-1